ncbi:hypothetical protein [Streptomyces sp. CC219B]|uniref:hypothetical protein n=1 Tax=Streptomyces sp. CC219B TaxID=3044574 RepID=UPI0024A872CF|nr:hypothetical protein [Streptomyces sp. CC219B]
MRPLYVPVRLAATVMAVAAAAGCMSVGEDGGGGSAKPSHSKGHRGGEAPDWGPAASGGGVGYGGVVADGERGDGKGEGKDKRKGEDEGEESASPSASVSAPVSGAPAPDKPGSTEKPGESEPTKAPPVPSRPADPEPTPTPPEPTPTAEPTPAEPSSSAPGDAGPQLVQREPAPEAGSPV